MSAVEGRICSVPLCLTPAEGVLVHPLGRSALRDTLQGLLVFLVLFFARALFNYARIILHRK